MPDPRFFQRTGPYRLSDIATRLGLQVDRDGGRTIEDIAPADSATGVDITYLADPRYMVQFAASRAGACITSAELAPGPPPACAVLVTKDPRAAFAAVAALFYPATENAWPRTLGVAPNAKVDPAAQVFGGAVIASGAEVGRGSTIGANAVIGPGVKIGEGCRIGANVTITHALLGNGVIIHPGVQIGQDGFGFTSTAAGHRKIPQLGRVIVEDDVEIGANSTIDRGALGDTVIGAGTKIDNLVQIGHNVVVGPRCIIVAQVGISGSCKIGAGVVIGGQAGLADHVEVGDGAKIAAKTGVMRDIPPGEAVMGYPARPIRQFWRDVAALTRLTRREK